MDSYKKNNGNLPVVEIVTNASYLDIVEYIQGAMSKLGLEININVMTPSSIKQGRAQGKLQSFRASWIADYPDEENYLSLFHSKNHTPNGPNYTHYTSSIYDKLMNEAIQETDLVKRKKKYRYLDSLMIQEAPIIPLFYDQVTLFVSKKVQGLEPNAINMLHLTRVRKSD